MGRPHTSLPFPSLRDEDDTFSVRSDRTWDLKQQTTPGAAELSPQSESLNSLLISAHYS